MRCMEQSQAGNRRNQRSLASAMHRAKSTVAAASDGKEAVEERKSSGPNCWKRKHPWAGSQLLMQPRALRPHFSKSPVHNHPLSQRKYLHGCIQMAGGLFGCAVRKTARRATPERVEWAGLRQQHETTMLTLGMGPGITLVHGFETRTI